MAKLKFPYTMHCPACKVGLKIKNAKMVGTIIKCPKCQKSIEIVTPDEDGYIPYTVEAPPEEEPEPEPTEEELEAKELEKIKAKRKKLWEKTRYVLGILWLVGLLAAVGGLVYYFVDFETLQIKSEQRGPQ